jgi:hypothetical protein
MTPRGYQASWFTIKHFWLPLILMIGTGRETLGHVQDVGVHLKEVGLGYGATGRKRCGCCCQKIAKKYV